MATKNAMVKKESTELETVEVDEDLQKMLAQDSGKGVSTDAADNLVPLIYVLQSNSPQVQEGNAQIEGARAGDIWLKNASDAVVSGKSGIWYQPSIMYIRWTEWVPRDKGGGFVASYDYTGANDFPDGAEKGVRADGRQKIWFPATGNECVATRYEAGHVWRDGQPLPYVIPFKSTGHTVSRGWMTKRQSQKKPDGSTWPAWSALYLLTTVMRKNNFGSWYMLEVGDPQFYISGMGKPHKKGLELVGGDAKRAYLLGRALETAFETGKVREEMETEPVDGNAPVGHGKMDDEIPF